MTDIDEREAQIRQVCDRNNYSDETIAVFLLGRLDACRLRLSGALRDVELREAEIERLRKVVAPTAPPAADAMEIAKREWYTRITEQPTVHGRIEELAKVIEAAEARGAAQMRERAAQICDSEAEAYKALYVLDGFPEDLKNRNACERNAKHIRALPLSEST